MAEAISSDQRRITKIQVWTGPSSASMPTLIQDITKHVTVATWNEDETQSPRWTCSITVESRGAPYDTLVPQVDGDLLHPLSGNEIRIFDGFIYSDGTEELAPCGVYRMSKPQINDDGTKIEIVITGNDRSVEVNRRGWTSPYPILGAPTIDAAIQTAMQTRMAGLTYNFEPSIFTVSVMAFGTQGGSGSGPMADLIGLAKDGGDELFFDSVGVTTLRTVPDPTSSPVVTTFTDDQNDVKFTAQRVLDETKTFNGVQLTGSPAGVVFPVQETVWVTDPTSPLNPATFGEVPYFVTSNQVSTGPQAIAAATAILQTMLTAYDDTSFTAANNSALCCGDVIGVVRNRIGINANYCISQIARSSDPKQPMTVTCRARRTAA
jgi:hypothetical protein